MNSIPQHLKYIAIAAAVIVIIAFAADRYSSFRERTLETSAAETKANAAETQRRAEQLESDAAAYREKIAYLEDRITEISRIARKQDEEIKLHSSRSNAARGDAERARGTRAIDTTTRQLCEKLAELGHGCE